MSERQYLTAEQRWANLISAVRDHVVRLERDGQDLVRRSRVGITPGPSSQLGRSGRGGGEDDPTSGPAIAKVDAEAEGRVTDPVRKDVDEMVELVEQAGILLNLAESKRRRALGEPPPKTVDVGELWCTNCHFHGVHSPIDKGGGGLCPACAKYWRRNKRPRPRHLVLGAKSA